MAIWISILEFEVMVQSIPHVLDLGGQMDNCFGGFLCDLEETHLSNEATRNDCPYQKTNKQSISIGGNWPNSRKPPIG